MNIRDKWGRAWCYLLDGMEMDDAFKHADEDIAKALEEKRIELLESFDSLVLEEKSKKMKEEEERTCENCYYHIYKDVCPVSFEAQGQLSSTGTFYCPYWTQRNSLARAFKLHRGEIK